MRVVNQITFEAKDDAEALRLASERLGKDAVILSTRMVRVGGFLGFFQRHVLMVSAGILEEDPKKESKKNSGEKDEKASRENLVAFQKLLEFKQASERPAKDRAVAPPLSKGKDRVVYSRAGMPPDSTESDSLTLSTSAFGGIPLRDVGDFEPVEALAAAPAVVPQQGTEAQPSTQALREEVGTLSRRLDQLMQEIEKTPPEQGKVLPKQEEAPPARFQAGYSNLVASIEPESNTLYKQLRAAEVDEAFVRDLLGAYGGVSLPFKDWLASRVLCAGERVGDALGGRKVMFLGPTGVGKTTTIAKLAATQALWEQKDVLLLTSDTYRIAAVDQLRTYAKILGVPIEVIFDVENFSNVLESHKDVGLILLDTAGRGQRDRKNVEALESLYKAFRPDAVHLVLAANMKYKDMLDVIKNLTSIPVTHLVFTKLDETVTHGAIYNVLQTTQRPASFFAVGQNVPNDIEVASGERLAALLLEETEK